MGLARAGFHGRIGWYHTQVWRFYQFITIFIKRIGAKPIFKAFKHWLYIAAKLFFCFFKIIIQHPITAIQVFLFHHYNVSVKFTYLPI